MSDDLPTWHSPRVAEIQCVVSAYYNLPQRQMVSRVKARAVARPRMLAMYMSRALTGQSLYTIGSRFGGRHHTSVLQAIRTIEDLQQRDCETGAAIQFCAAKLAEVVADRISDLDQAA